MYRRDEDEDLVADLPRPVYRFTTTNPGRCPRCETAYPTGTHVVHVRGATYCNDCDRDGVANG